MTDEPTSSADMPPNTSAATAGSPNPTTPVAPRASQVPPGAAVPEAVARALEAPPIAQPSPASSPFANEAQVMSEGVPTRDDISATQATSTATRDVSSAHIARLLYLPLGVPGGPVYQSQALEQLQRARRP
jgi:hypothetical protein